MEREPDRGPSASVSAVSHRDYKGDDDTPFFASEIARVIFGPNWREVGIRVVDNGKGFVSVMSLAPPAGVKVRVGSCEAFTAGGTEPRPSPPERTDR